MPTRRRNVRGDTRALHDQSPPHRKVEIGAIHHAPGIITYNSTSAIIVSGALSVEGRPDDDDELIAEAVVTAAAGGELEGSGWWPHAVTRLTQLALGLET